MGIVKDLEREDKTPSGKTEEGPQKT